jgi:hypothetical protein
MNSDSDNPPRPDTVPDIVPTQLVVRPSAGEDEILMVGSKLNPIEALHYE